MAKVIKLKDRQGGIVLPLTRSQLVQVSEITGLNLLDSKSWTKASVQDALEALYSYVKTNNGAYDKDIKKIEDALTGILDNQRTVVNYVDSQDTTYLNQAKTYTGEQIQALGSTTATNGQYVTAIGVDATGKLTTTTKQVAGSEVSSAAITGQATVDAALSYLKTSVDTAYTNAEQYTDEKVDALKTSLASSITVDSGKVITGVTQTNGTLSGTTAYLNAGDIKRTNTSKVPGTDVETALENLADAIQTGGTGSVVSVKEITTGLADSVLKAYEIWQGPDSEPTNKKGTINIPKDLVVTSGSVVNGTWSGDTFTEGSGTDKALKLVIANQTAPVYINPTDFIDVYTANNQGSEVTVAIDNSNNITASIGTVAATKISYNGSNVNTELTNINATLVAHQNDLTAYQGRIAALETAANALSYTVTDDSAYISVASSTTNGATTFTVTTNDIASDTNLQALQTSYNNMNTELTNMGVFYERVGSNEIADPTLDTF